MGTVLREAAPPPGFVLDAAPPPGFVLDNPVAPPIPQRRPEFETRPGSIEEATGGLVTPGLAAGLGGVGGTALGLPGGPVTAGLLGAGGAVSGRLAYETLEDTLRRFGVLSGPRATVADVGGMIGEELMFEAAGLGLGAAARPVQAASAALGKILGVGGDRAKELIGQAKRAGLPGLLGAADVGGPVARATSKALSVFPFTGTPARRNLATKEARVSGRVNDILNELAPNALLRNQLGLELFDKAGKRWNAFKRLTGRLGDNFDNLARGASRKDLIPTENVGTQALDFMDRAQRGAVELLSGDKLSEPTKNRVMEYVLELAELPQNIDIDQYRRIVRDLGGLMDEIERQAGKGAQFSDAAALKEALEIDLQNIRTDVLPEGEAEALSSALRAFNKTYSKGIEAFQTPTAKQFLKVDKNKFRGGPARSGTLNADELGDLFANMRSPKAIDDLEAVVGKKGMRDAGRSFIDNALRQATSEAQIGDDVVDVVNIDDFMRNLGLTGKKLNREGLMEFFKRAGMDFEPFEDLLKAAKSIERGGDPSTFVMRRTILGGVPAIMGAAGAGAAVAGGKLSLPEIAALTYLFRRASDVVSSPKAMENMRAALAKGIQPSARRQALSRAMVAAARAGSEGEEARERAAARPRTAGEPARVTRRPGLPGPR